MTSRAWSAALTLVLVISAPAGCVRRQVEPSTPRPHASMERTIAPPAITPVEPTATPPPEPAPEPKPKPEPQPEPQPAAPTDNKTRGWYYVPNDEHEPPGIAPGAGKLLAAYDGRYLGPRTDLVYLTFDQGYENGNTAEILDALERNDVIATFFVTEAYIRNNPTLVRRMVSQGHVVANHSATHPSMPSLAKDRDAFESELAKTARAFKSVTGTTMPKVFRPPMGEYSPLSLWLTADLGYESVFWSFAHRDWVVDDQPPVATTVKRILGGSHPGAIYLLHGVSSSDTQALDKSIAGLREQGYGFGVLGR